eukprot:Nk52_evm3s307 gene=Nk52_evmTU3s307
MLNRNTNRKISVLFLGTGQESCVPALRCLLLNKASPANGPVQCDACKRALAEATGGRCGMGSENKVKDKSMGIKFHRLNTHMAICVEERGSEQKGMKGEDSESPKTYLMGCQSNFFKEIITHFPRHQLRELNGVFLFGGGNDGNGYSYSSCLGLDDLRGWTIHGAIQPTVDVYMDAGTGKLVERVYPYIVDTSRATGGGDVPKLNLVSLVRHQCDGDNVVKALLSCRDKACPFEHNNNTCGCIDPGTHLLGVYCDDLFIIPELPRAYVQKMGSFCQLPPIVTQKATCLVIGKVGNERARTDWPVSELKRLICEQPWQQPKVSVYFVGICHSVSGDEMNWGKVHREELIAGGQSTSLLSFSFPNDGDVVNVTMK